DAAANQAAAAPERRVLLLGGTSEIGLAIVRRLARDGPVSPYLIGRSEERLGQAVSELESAGCRNGSFGLLDIRELAQHQEALSRAFERMGGFDTVVLAAGVLGGQGGVDAGLDPAPMSTTAEAVADATVTALGTDAHTVWVPGRLRLVFALLRHLPRAIFRRLPL